ARAGEYPSSTDVSVKIDRRLSDRQNLFGRFSQQNSSDQKPNFLGNVASPDLIEANVRTRSLTLDDSYARGRWILHGNYGYAYTAVLIPPAAPGFDPVSLGFPASIRSGLEVANFPTISLGGTAAGLGPSPNNAVTDSKFENHTLSGDAIHVAAGHTV